MKLLDVTSGVIVHQVNCQGVMGAGLALAIRNLYPFVYHQYRKFTPKLGQIQLIRVSDTLWVCNLAGQDRYGRDKRYTDYEAHRVAWTKLYGWAVILRGLTVHAPIGIGCGLAGGDWKVMRRLIDEHCPKVEFHGEPDFEYPREFTQDGCTTCSFCGQYCVGAFCDDCKAKYTEDELAEHWKEYCEASIERFD